MNMPKIGDKAWNVFFGGGGFRQNETIRFYDIFTGWLSGI